MISSLIHSTSSYSGKIYTTGSFNHPCDVHICDIETGKWCRGASRPTANYNISIGVVRGKLFVCGGGVDTCDLYDPETDK